MAGGWSARARMSGPLTRYTDGFEAELRSRGYRRGSVDAQLLMVARFDAWLAARGVDAPGLTAEVVAEFIALRAAAGMHFRSPKGLAPLLGYLRALGVAPPACPAAETPLEVLLERFGGYLIAERDLTAGTVAARVRIVRPFLATAVTDKSTLELERLAPQAAAEFIVASCADRGPRWAREATCALRSLLRFLHLDGLVDAELAASVPSVAGWRLTGLPPRLGPDEVRRLIDSCDTGTAVGCRDRAVLTVLARLGLRAGEVAALTLEDIDWRAGVLRVRNGKRQRIETLPLPADVGETIADYLLRTRPRDAPDRRVFQRMIAPAGGVSGVVVSEVVRSAARRAGIGEVGSHALRHAAATDMLRAGAPLTEVGQVLRHRLPRTTAIYAKVDLDRLGVIARPWPQGATS